MVKYSLKKFPGDNETWGCYGQKVLKSGRVRNICGTMAKSGRTAPARPNSFRPLCQNWQNSQISKLKWLEVCVQFYLHLKQIPGIPADPLIPSQSLGHTKKSKLRHRFGKSGTYDADFKGSASASYMSQLHW